MTLDFKPNIFLRGAMTQTFLASLKLRKRGPNAMVDAAREHIVECRDGARLRASWSPHPNSKGVAILLHGWEGSQDSAYVTCHGRYLYDHGYSVFRLNYRDHGDSHHLNEGLFHAPQFGEVYDGVAYACGLESGPAFLTGFSLGGNFALRIVRACITEPVENLQHVFAVSPVINPLGTAGIADKNLFIRRYFVKKFKASLRKKQLAHPDVYNFEDVLKNNTVSDLSEVLLARHFPNFSTSDDFYAAYAIGLNDLKEALTRHTLIFAKDDPVVPSTPAQSLVLGANGDLILHKNGGHNGFFDSVMGPTWYDRFILNALETGYA